MCSAVCALQTVLLLLFAAHQALAQCSSAPSLTFTGRLLCYGVGISRTSISLEHKVGFVDNHIGIAKTNEDGSFEIDGEAIFMPGDAPPHLSLRLEYSHISKQDTFRVRQGDDVRLPFDGANTHVGDLNVDTSTCEAYTAFYNATMDYYDRVGQQNPVRFFIARSNVEVETPYVVYTEVIFLDGYQWTEGAAQHELAHVIRHYYDVDEAHFEGDVEKFGSEQNLFHDCDSDTSEGFAFNEGWALYWENACLDSDGEGAHTVEGNVAAAIRNLEEECGSSPSQMWQVLKESAGEIHSFAEYRSQHTKILECP